MQVSYQLIMLFGDFIVFLHMLGSVENAFYHWAVLAFWMYIFQCLAYTCLFTTLEFIIYFEFFLHQSLIYIPSELCMCICMTVMLNIKFLPLEAWMFKKSISSLTIFLLLHCVAYLGLKLVSFGLAWFFLFLLLLVFNWSMSSLFMKESHKLGLKGWSEISLFLFQ